MGNAGFNAFSWDTQASRETQASTLFSITTLSQSHTPLLELEISGWKHEYFRAKGKDGILIRFFLLGSAGGDLFSFTATRRNRVLRVQGLARF